MLRNAAVALTLLLVCFRPQAFAAELKPETIAAFDRYVRATEARMDAAGPFILGTLPKDDLLIERMTTREKGREIEIPGGIVHHWMGTIFIAGIPIDRVAALLQDYDSHATTYAPMVARSRLIARNGDTFRSSMRFVTKKVITVVEDTDHEGRFTHPGPGRVEARIHSTRVQQVEDAGTAQETLLPAGNDDGYLWRLNTYWRLQEGNGGTYVQCESLSLTRRIPAAFAWLIGPFVNSVPRETLTFTMERTRAALRR